MFDHLSITVTDLAASTAFYRGALAPTGHTRVVELPGGDGGAPHAVGFCHDDGSDLWIAPGPGCRPPVHIALRVPTRAAVHAFHAAALAAGGRDNGAPGLRPHYHARYDGAFVLDPDGNNNEAFCHDPQ